jgi:nucleoside-diphosphate-sugar epimerase
MQNILLIGGAGYIGTVVTDYLLKKNYNVKIIDNLIYNSASSKKFLKNNKKISFLNLDIRNIKSDNIFLKNIDAAILLAGLVGDPITKKYPQLSEEINDIGNKCTIDAIANSGIKKLIYISTCSNYGLIPDNTQANEEYILNPISLYAKSKVNIEKYILSKNIKDFSTTILRFATAFGESPRMRFDLTINEFIYEMLHNKKLLVFDPDTWRPYCHVLDFARLIELIINSKNELVNNQVFNAGSDENNFTKRQIVNLISKYVDGCNIDFQEHGKDPRNYKVDFKKVRETLNFQPNFNVQNCIVDLINFIKQFKKINKKEYGNYYIGQNE